MNPAHIQELTLNSQSPPMKSKATCLWVESERMGCYEVAVPKVPKRRWQQVLPWALDEVSLDSPETMHIVFGDADKSTQTLSVIAIPHEQMLLWNETINQHQIETSKICPDVLALPLHESGHESGHGSGNDYGWSIWQQNEQRCLVRTGQLSGFIANPLWLQQLLKALDQLADKTTDSGPESTGPELLESRTEASQSDGSQSNSQSGEKSNTEKPQVSLDLVSDLESKEVSHRSLASQKPDSINVYTNLNSDQSSNTLADDLASALQHITVQPLSISEPGWPFQQAQIAPPVNLLQGQYKPAFDLKKKIQNSVNVTALLTGVLVVLMWVFIAVDIFQISDARQKLQQQLVQQWQSFLNVRHDPRLTVSQWLQLIEKQLSQIVESRQQSPWSMLVFMDSVLSSCAGKCQIETMMIASGELNLTLIGEPPQLLTLQQQLNSKPLQGYRIHWDKISAGGNKVTIRLKPVAPLATEATSTTGS